jgi:nitrogen fixation protein FixH
MTQTIPAFALGPVKARRSRGLTGWSVLGILLGSFAAVGSINATMIYYAVSTFRGEVEPHPYEHGLAYNRDIAAARTQAARHWSVSAHVVNSGAMKTIEARFQNGDKAAVDGLTVTANLEFATDMTRDRHVVLSEATPGVYRGQVAAETGNWELVIDAKRGAKQIFLSRSRIMIP